MSKANNSLRWSVRKRQIPNAKGKLSEQFSIYKNWHSGYVGEMTELINKIKTCLETNKYSKLGDYDNRVGNAITKTRGVTIYLIDLISKDLKESDKIL